MALGPLTEQALRDAGTADPVIDGIRAGTFEWQIRLASAIGMSFSEQAASEMARMALVRKDFLLHVWQMKEAQWQHDPHRLHRRTVTKQLLANDVGQRIARARDYEEALAARGGGRSVLFAAGNLDDWGQVAAESTWSVLAFNFDRAAHIVATSHSPDAPAPTLALLQLCRHALELHMKMIIDAGQRLAGDTPHVRITHQLSLLWDEACPYLRRAWSNDVWSEDDARRAHGIVKAFEEIDSTAMTTRYPVDRDGSVYERPAELLNFSIKKMMAEYEFVVSFFVTGRLWIELPRRIAKMPPEGPIPEDDDD
jgi:hypothetical protein